MQTWATFSIVDHRKPIYRQALALFDRIVVPVPPAPIGDQTQDELTQLKADIEYLAKHGAAEFYPWSSEDFQDWRQPFLAEAAAVNINRDIFHDTRLMVAEKFSSSLVQAVPVYGGQEHYDASRRQLMQTDEALTLEILQRLPVPSYDTPLEDLITLRNSPAFRNALDDMLEWKRLRIPAIVLEQDRPAAIAAAMRDFDKLTTAYAAAMEAQGYKKATTIGSIFFSVITGELLGAFKEGLVSFREVREPVWKKVSELKCAPGGVVYHFNEALQ